MLSHSKCCYARAFPQCISVRAFGKLFLETVRSAISAAVHNPDKFSVFCRISVLSGNPDIHNPYKTSREHMCPD